VRLLASICLSGGDVSADEDQVRAMRDAAIIPTFCRGVPTCEGGRAE
jgi:hypothetical protein